MASYENYKYKRAKQFFNEIDILREKVYNSLELILLNPRVRERSSEGMKVL